MLVDQYLTTYQESGVTTDLSEETGKRERGYAQERFIRTKFVRLVVSLDRLLVKRVTVVMLNEKKRKPLTFQASSKSMGKITYRFLRTAVD
jgi:hypothetical protein